MSTRVVSKASTFDPAAYCEQMRSRIASVVSYTLAAAADQAIELTPVGATGDLKEGYTNPEVIATPGRVEGSFGNKMPYAYDVEYGQPPGTYVDPNDLIPWVQAVLGVPEAIASQVAARVSAGILAHGTHPQRILWSALEAVRETFNSDLRATLHETGA